MCYKRFFQRESQEIDLRTSYVGRFQSIFVEKCVFDVDGAQLSLYHKAILGGHSIVRNFGGSTIDPDTQVYAHSYCLGFLSHLVEMRNTFASTSSD